MRSSKSMVAPANAVGGRSARACDYCIKTRARWYCAADDAFLCQSCDSSVHSANPLARRHHRVRLKTASLKDDVLVPQWHRDFTRKARTPRQKKMADADEPLTPTPHRHPCPEDQLLYRVPSLDLEDGEKTPVLNDFLPSEMDLAEFAADVESLLGKGLEDESFDMEELGILDVRDISPGDERFKEEEEDEAAAPDHQPFIGRLRHTFEQNYEYHFYSPFPGEEEDKPTSLQDSNRVPNLSENFLKLNHKEVLSAWDSRKSPWTTGERPDPNSSNCWLPDCTGFCGKTHLYGPMGSFVATTAVDGGREARVSRYREKRRTRLFSKKIRYEVRRLNAEKRPRMKGRFVKRTK